jgi:hypothetical protein
MTSRACSPRLHFIAAAVAVLFLISFAARSVSAWKYWGDLDHNSPGTWLCMADDVRHGVLYRPPVSDLGYGGTRYMPLFPVIIAAGLATGLGIVQAGFVAGLLAAAVAASGLLALLRRLGVPMLLAISLALMLPAATCARTLVLGIKGDLLPVGLNLWGLAMAVAAAEKKNKAALPLAAVFFVLAVTAKITSIFGVATAVIWLLAEKNTRQAVLLGGLFLIALVMAAIVIQIASGGWALTIFRLCASGGGSAARLLKGPKLLILDALHQDKTICGLWGMAILLIAGTQRWFSLPAILLILCTAGTVLIYGSPGTHLNHLVDMDAAALLVIATLTLQKARLQFVAVICTLALVLMASAGCWRQMRELRQRNERGQMMAVLADAEASSIRGPILSEDPLLPMLYGQRPYMLDPFMFRAIRAGHPGFADRFGSDLDNKHFQAVVLRGPPDDPAYESNEFDIGPGFIARLERTYLLTAHHGSFYVFMPEAREVGNR